MAKHSERLKTALEMRGMRPSVLSYKTGVSEAAISHYLKGDYEPKHKKMQLLAAALHVSEAWLSGFDVPMVDTDNAYDSLTNSETLREYVVFHRDGKNVKVKFTPEQKKIFDALVESTKIEDIND